MRYLAGALFFVTLAAAQNAQPRRAPDVPFVPTTNGVVDAMLKLANVTKDDLVYDLGCGDGRIVVAAAKNYGARAVGVDINPVRIQEATENAKKNGVWFSVRFEENDLFQVDFHDATVVALYLLPDVNLRLKPRLLRELKPGTRVVSHSFTMGDDWKPEKEQTVDGAYIYLWRVPEKSDQAPSAGGGQGRSVSPVGQRLNFINN